MKMYHIKWQASWFCLALLLSACQTQTTNHTYDKAVSISHFCEVLAVQIAAQYDKLTPNTLPVQYKTDADAKRFIPLNLPSHYDVIFQHKGYEAVISHCLERHQQGG